MNVSSRRGTRALAATLGAALVCAVCAPVVAQNKPPTGEASKGEASKGEASKGEASKGEASKGEASQTAAPAKPRRRNDKPTKNERAKARAAFERGEAKLKKAEFAGAVEDYRAADALIPSAQAQYKIAFCLDKLGNRAALEAYDEFLQFPPPESMAEQKGLAEARVNEMSKATLRVEFAPAGAKVMVDGAPATGASPLTVTVKAGAHRVEVAAPDHAPASQEVTVAAGQAAEVSIKLTALPPPPPVAAVASASAAASAVASAPPPAPPAPAPAVPPPSKVPAYVTLGLGGVGAVVGTIYGLKALSAKSDFKTQKTSAKADEVEQSALVADMAFGVAVTLGITGAVLLFTDGEGKAAEPTTTAKIRLTPIITPQTQGAAAVVRF